MTFRAVALLVTFSALAVTCAPLQELVPTKDPGVARAALILNPAVGVDVLRLEFQPGAARSVHQHDDVRFHLFLSISGSIEVTMGDKKVAAAPGEAFLIEKGTPHGFRNTGKAPASGYEVFIRDPKPGVASNGDSGGAIALALAALRQSNP
jgi:mannose-6-phosphate isomerase-like protein (cupin superfamily)